MTTTADDVWRLLAELVEAQKETERRFQATDRQITRLSQEIGILCTATTCIFYSRTII